MIPTELQNYLNALEKDLDEIGRKREELDKELKKPDRTPERAKVGQTTGGKILNFKPFWIPIPVWTKAVKPPDYATTDPEWKEFLKLEEDTERVKQLKAAIGRDIAEAVSDGLPPGVERSWGFDGNIGYSSNHIDFVFPWGPPVVYERPGLLVSPNGITWTMRKLSDERGRRFYRIFHPKIFALSFWEGGKVFCTHRYHTLRNGVSKYIGLEQKSPEPPNTSRRLTVAERDKLIKAFKIKKPPSLLTAEDPSDVIKALVPSPAPNSAMEAAVRAYKKKHSALQATAWKECPRGGCWLTGFVDVIGTRVTIRVTVKAIYLPAKDIFLGSPIVGDAVVMPKVSRLTADREKVEQMRAEKQKDEKSQSSPPKTQPLNPAKPKEDKVKIDPPSDQGEGKSPE